MAGTGKNAAQRVPLFFSINGPDNIGKTTQVKMIPSRWDLMKMSGIHRYSKRLLEMSNNGSMKRWWFGTDNKDFVCCVFDALKQRRDIAIKSLKPAVFDRGATMFQAVCIARIAYHDKVGISSAETTFKQLKNDIGEEWPSEKLTILIRHEVSLEKAVALALEHEKDVGEEYQAYQTLLHQALASQIEAGAYTVVVNRNGKTCLEVHNEICGILRAQRAPSDWTPLLRHVDCLVGFGGLSEAGKSTVATASAAYFGNHGIRLKIVYFMRLATRELKRSVYDLPEDEQAFWLILEIDRFADAHPWLKVICIDSLHRYTSTAVLQRILAGKAKIVFIDTEETTRFKRVNISMEEFRSKDKTKMARGAHRVREVADLIVDNNKEFDDTVASVTAMLKKYVNPAK